MGIYALGPQFTLFVALPYGCVLLSVSRYNTDSSTVTLRDNYGINKRGFYFSSNEKSHIAKIRLGKKQP